MALRSGGRRLAVGRIDRVGRGQPGRVRCPGNSARRARCWVRHGPPRCCAWPKRRMTFPSATPFAFCLWSRSNRRRCRMRCASASPSRALPWTFAPSRALLICGRLWWIRRPQISATLISPCFSSRTRRATAMGSSRILQKRLPPEAFRRSPSPDLDGQTTLHRTSPASSRSTCRWRAPSSMPALPEVLARSSPPLPRTFWPMRPPVSPRASRVWHRNCW